MQTELLSAQTENRRLKDEVALLTDKLKQAHSEKMQADKKASEMFAASSKTEAALEDVRQQYDKMCIELERGKRSVHEYVFRLNDYERKEEHYKRIKGEYDKVCQELQHYKQERKDNADDSEYDLQRVQQQLDIKATELVGIRSKLDNVEKDRQRLVQENVYLISSLEEVKKEKDQLRVQLEEEGRHKVEVQLAELKKDLAQSVTEWDDFEKEKMVKDGLIKQLQVDYTRERERSHMLQRQCSVFEEKCKVLTQELSVYRSIDVYHSTLNAELKAYKEKSGLEKSASSAYMSTSLPYTRSYTFTNTHAQSRAPIQVHALFNSQPIGRPKTPAGSGYKTTSKERPLVPSPGLGLSRSGVGYVEELDVSSPMPLNARRLSLEEMEGEGEDVSGSEQDAQIRRSVGGDGKQREMSTGGGRYGDAASGGLGKGESSAYSREVAGEQKQAEARQERLKRKADREQRLRESVLQQERGKFNVSLDSEGGRSISSVFSYSPPKRTTTPPAYSKGGSVRDMSQMKKDLEKARRLISM
ncbi:hypothetical protein EON65_11860 [archaeon]|nr:MAG: hypothetical protein EON65_11860 [archaeon]